MKQKMEKTQKSIKEKTVARKEKQTGEKKEKKKAPELSAAPIFDANFLWLADQANNPIVCLSSEQKVLYMNPVALRLFQYQPKAVLDKSFLRLLKKKNLTTELPKQCQDRGEVINIFSALSQHNWADLEWMCRQLREVNGADLGYVLVGHPIVNVMGVSENKKPDQFDDELIMHKQPVSLRQLIDDVVNLVKPHAEKQGLLVGVNYPTSIPDAGIEDHEIFYRILLGLLDNAIKYTREGHVFVNIELMEQVSDNLLLRLMVEDTGVGLTREEYEKIFEDRNLHYSRTIDLDLFTIKQLIESINGEIFVESTSGKGSVFSLMLPLRVLTLSQNPNPTVCCEKRIDDKKAKEENGKTKVLVVEDDRICQEAVRALLDELDCLVDIANSAQETLKRLVNHYDVILMDIGLPDKDGMSLMFDIRTKLNLETPTIAVTAYKWDDDRYAERGFDSVLKKPLSKEKLKHALFKALSSRKT